MKTIRVLPVIIAAAILATFMTSCEKTTIDAKYGDKRTSFNELTIGELNLTPNLADSESKVYEFETDATFTGGAKASGEYATGMNQAGDSISVVVSVDNSGFYDLVFIQKGDESRVNCVAVDGMKMADITPVYDTAKYIYLSAGEHTVTMTPSWGYVDFDKLEVKASDIDSEKVFNVTASLTNPNADEHTRMLYKFLCDIYGHYTLSGQYADKGRESDEYKAILDATGESFAVLGLDMNGYSTAAVRNNMESHAVEYAHDWYYNAGGIVQMCWHWLSPKAYTTDGKEWWDSFRAESSDIDLDVVMNGGDDRCLELLDDDIDRIAEQFKRLQEDGVPILWRPLHEASGGWFWWGECEPESYIKLWRHMYDKLTNEHGLSNLIWVWNGQDEAWYPGDDVVDIVAWDIYPGEREYGPYSSTFARCYGCTDGENKLIALSENGCVMDPDEVYEGNARWLYWGIWSGEFCVENGVLSERYTDKSMLQKAYSSDYTLTLSELPNLRKYPLE